MIDKKSRMGETIYFEIQLAVAVQEIKESEIEDL